MWVENILMGRTRRQRIMGMKRRMITMMVARMM